MRTGSLEEKGLVVSTSHIIPPLAFFHKYYILIHLSLFWRELSHLGWVDTIEKLTGLSSDAILIEVSG